MKYTFSRPFQKKRQEMCKTLIVEAPGKIPFSMVLYTCEEKCWYSNAREAREKYFFHDDLMCRANRLLPAATGIAARTTIFSTP